jgi:hypothetical protein
MLRNEHAMGDRRVKASSLNVFVPYKTKKSLPQRVVIGEITGITWRFHQLLPWPQAVHIV